MQLTLGSKGSTFCINFNYMFEASYFEPLDDSAPLWDLKYCGITHAALYPHGFLLKN